MGKNGLTKSLHQPNKNQLDFPEIFEAKFQTRKNQVFALIFLLCKVFNESQ